MTAQPDIVFIGHGAERSGPPVLLLHLQRWLAAHTDLRFATLVARGGPLVGEFEALGPVRVRDHRAMSAHLAQRALDRFGGHRSAGRLEAVRSQLAARPLGSPTVVYANTVAPQTASLVRSVLRDDMRLVVHVHELASTLRHRIRADDLRWLLTRADKIIAASEAVRSQLTDCFEADPARVSVCYEFVDPVDRPTDDRRRILRSQSGLGEECFVIAGSGRIDWRKAPELLAQALWLLRREHPEADARVVWIGGAGNEDRWRLEHDLSTMGLEGAFTIVGEQADPTPWIQTADVFALSSREDAFPLACLEASGAALPLVTYDTGGMVEFVEESRGGTVVAYPDVAAFAGALGEYLDPRRRREKGEAGAAHVRARHAVEVGAPCVHAEIEALLGGSGR